MRNRAPALGAALLLGVTVGLLGLSASASGSAASALAVKPKPSPSPSPSPTPSGTFVKAYTALVNGSQLNLTPLDVQATSDGGYIALAEAQSAAGLGVDWLVKLDATGVPKWHEQVGCASPQGGPGDYAYGVSVQQTADGGYIVGGQTIDCGSGSTCPPLSGRSCALVEKLDPAGKLTWARVYAASLNGSVLDQIRQTTDGGYIAAGSFTGPNQYTGALILKLDSAGNVQWQKDLGPTSTTAAYFNSVQQTAGGGYVADGTSIIQTADGGYAVAGRWYDQAFNGGNGAQGALLLKLDSSGTLQWQHVYTGGCYLNGYNTCANLGAVSYSLQQASDGGYVMVGSGDLELSSSVYLVPWLAKTDASGNLLWQHFYYQSSAEYGTPLSQNFQASTLAPDSGFPAIAATRNASTQKDELYAVKTDGSGLAGTCGDVHPATPLQAISPGLTAVAPSLPHQAATTQAASSPITTLPASTSTHQDC